MLVTLLIPSVSYSQCSENLSYILPNTNTFNIYNNTKYVISETCLLTEGPKTGEFSVLCCNRLALGKVVFQTYAGIYFYSSIVKKKLFYKTTLLLKNTG